MNSTPISLAEVAAQVATLSLDGGGWHPTLSQALADLSADQAAWRPAADRNSVHDIVRHLTLWKRAVLEGFDTPWTREGFRTLSAADWQPLDDGADWESDRQALLDVSETLREKVRGCDDAFLASGGLWGPQENLWFVLNCLTHDGYHAGQIMLLRRLQGV